MKRLLLLILIVLSALAAWWVQKNTIVLTAQQKSLIEEQLLAIDSFPARPVWWSNDRILALGILPSTDANLATQQACELLIAQQLPFVVNVEVYDVLKIQAEDDWSLLAKRSCE